MFATPFCYYLRAAAARHRPKPGPSRPNIAACRPRGAPCRCKLHTAAAAPDTLCDLTEKEKEAQSERSERRTDHIYVGFFFHVGALTFLSSLVNGRCQLEVGVDGGGVLQEEPDTSSTAAAAGVEERCGSIC